MEADEEEVNGRNRDVLAVGQMDPLERRSLGQRKNGLICQVCNLYGTRTLMSAWCGVLRAYGSSRMRRALHNSP